MRKAAKRSGGRNSRPILMTSHVEPQIAQSKQYTASVRPLSGDDMARRC